MVKTGKYTQGYRLGVMDSTILGKLEEHGIVLHICNNFQQAQYWVARIRGIIYHSDPNLLKLCKATTRDNIMVLWSLGKFNEPKLTQAMMDEAYRLESVTENKQLSPVVGDIITRRIHAIINKEEEPVLENEDAIKDYIMGTLRGKKDE
jgi:hypothetical protein